MPKTPSETPLRRTAKGGLLRSGNPGNKGGGKTPEAFKLACQQLASSADRFALAKRVLDDPDTYPSLWLGALKWATEHGYGKPTEHVELTGQNGGPVSVIFTRE